MGCRKNQVGLAPLRKEQARFRHTEFLGVPSSPFLCCFLSGNMTVQSVPNHTRTCISRMLSSGRAIAGISHSLKVRKNGLPHWMITRICAMEKGSIICNGTAPHFERQLNRCLSSFVRVKHSLRSCPHLLFIEGRTPQTPCVAVLQRRTCYDIAVKRSKINGFLGK